MIDELWPSDYIERTPAPELASNMIALSDAKWQTQQNAKTFEEARDAEYGVDARRLRALIVATSHDPVKAQIVMSTLAGRVTQLKRRA